MKRIMILFLTTILTFSLAACGGKQSTDDGAVESQSAEKLAEQMETLMLEEQSVFDENPELWAQVTDVLKNEGTTMELAEDYNYGDCLLACIDFLKDRLAADELELLQKGGERIKAIEEDLATLNEQYLQMEANVKTDDTQTFPQFEGKDLEGNSVDSSIISDHAFTVLNFWFITCKPCVNELDELEALSKEVEQQGGVLLGINSFTLDGDAQALADAKEVLAAKGVTYQNLYFDSASDAGKFTNISMAFPATYVLDRSGSVVGAPIVGSIDSDEQKAKLVELIDTALERDQGNGESVRAGE